MKTGASELIFGVLSAFFVFINGVIASGFGAAAYYFYRYHKAKDDNRKRILDGKEPLAEIHFSIGTLLLFVFLGMFVGYVARETIEAYMMCVAKDAELVRAIAAIINPATALAGFLFMPILSTIEKFPIAELLTKFFGGKRDTK